MIRIRNALLLVTLIVVSTGVSFGVFTAFVPGETGSPGPEAQPSTPPAFTPPDSTPGRPSSASRDSTETVLDDASIRATAEAESTGHTIRVSGTSTAGSVIYIADREIQLPGDAWVVSMAIEIYCQEGGVCPPVPYYKLQRGESTIEVDADGRIWIETVSPADEEPFEFLKRHFGRLLDLSFSVHSRSLLQIRESVKAVFR